MAEERKKTNISNFSCMDCGRNASLSWWKCCPEHTTELGDDVKCRECAESKHPGLTK